MPSSIAALSALLKFIFLSFAVQTFAQTWPARCPPGGQFLVPEISSVPLLVFRCVPIITPYLEDDDSAGILIDSFLEHSRYGGAEPITFPSGLSKVLDVAVSFNGRTLATAAVPLNSRKFELHFPLANLSRPRKQPFDIDCVATYTAHSDAEYESQKFNVKTVLRYMEKPVSGSVTKRDARTGALLVKPSSGGPYETIFPIGFYTSFDNYLDSDLSILDNLKEQGFTIVHPVPTFGDLNALAKVLDRMEELGLYLIYDMRHTYKNLASITAEVNMIKARPNLLLWYTADEPDGTSEPLNATRVAHDVIYALDGYHPVSIALNCADYEFAAYTAGADIIMPDTYTIANDPAFSAKYHTPCTVDFGCCGCDNCRGEFEDISRRLDDFALRLDVLGWNRDKAVWSVPQAFGGEEFWDRPPTGSEFAIQVILSVNHGARGIMPWIDPTPSDVKSIASSLAKALTSVKGLILSPSAAFQHVTSNRIDVETLILVANLNAHDAEVTLPLPNAQNLRQVFNYGLRRSSVGGQSRLVFELEGLGCAAFVASSPRLMLNQQGDEL
ncbi:hypothetical protein B0H10DRAFT_2165261 [Mycena sp. CBHHK59/15]|nr:hypothetical protein B0H10DRAFT_2165261 [Mycena sp. CBHHK59/15]